MMASCVRLWDALSQQDSQLESHRIISEKECVLINSNVLDMHSSTVLHLCAHPVAAPEICSGRFLYDKLYDRSFNGIY